MILKSKDYVDLMTELMKSSTKSYKRKPKLAIIFAKDYSKASERYIRNKHKLAEQVGIDIVEFGIELERLDEVMFEQVMYKLIQELNRMEDVDGIIVQLPIPYLDENEVASWIHPDKDVDGFHPTNLGKIMRGEDCLKSCTPKGIVDFLKTSGIPLDGTNVCIVGRSNIVGKPLANLLINEGSTVTVCNSKTRNLQGMTSMADIVITAVGKPKYFTREYFNNHATVIDVGINFDENGKMCGDVDFDDVVDFVENITPVPGGVGATTVLSLMQNTIKAYEMKQGVLNDESKILCV